MDKFNNWVARKANWIALIFVIFAYTLGMFFLGMVYEWEKYGRVTEVEIQTKIIQYKLGDLTIGVDTIDVIKAAKYDNNK